VLLAAAVHDRYVITGALGSSPIHSCEDALVPTLKLQPSPPGSCLRGLVQSEPRPMLLLGSSASRTSRPLFQLSVVNAVFTTPNFTIVAWAHAIAVARVAPTEATHAVAA
jgi:hypothetical protein